MASTDQVIKFGCSYCGVELEMPEDAAGEDVDCPDCGHFLVVPPPSMNPVGGARSLLPSERPATASIEVEEPAASVTVCGVCGATFSRSADACHVCGTPRGFDLRRMRGRPRGIFVGEIFTTASRVFLRNLAVLSPFVLVEALVAILLYGMLRTMVFIGLMRGIPALSVVAVVTIYCVYHALHVKHFRFMLAVARGEPVERGSASGGHFGTAVRMVAVSNIFWAAVFFGTVLAIAPAIVFAVLAWPCGRLVVDRDLSAGAAVSQAIDLTAPHWPGVLSVMAILAAMNAAIGFVAVGVGQVVVPGLVLCVLLPFSSLVLTVTYLRLCDEPTGVDATVD